MGNRREGEWISGADHWLRSNDMWRIMRMGVLSHCSAGAGAAAAASAAAAAATRRYPTKVQTLCLFYVYIPITLVFFCFSL